MKKLLTVAFIALFSTTVQAENSEPLASAEVVVSDVVSENVIAKAEQNDGSLWLQLDSNQDGAISKAEAALSKKISDNWASLDLNKDEVLDTEEFIKIFTMEN